MISLIKLTTSKLLIRQIQKRFGWNILMIGALMFSGCDPQRIYDHSLKVPSKGWHMHHPVYFELEMTDTIGYYSFYINVRNNTGYSYSNFYVFLTTFFPNGQIARDTVELVLADQTGKWKGKGFGRIKDNRFLVRSGLQFPYPGPYRFAITHGMRDTLLTGIENIGIRIEKW